MRTLIIGDIHGCYAEFKELLTAFDYQTGDRIIALGDIIGRGPSPAECLDLLKTIGADCILGNHEYWLLHEIETGEYKTAESQCDFKKADRFADYIRTFKHFIETDEYIVVHAGFDPRKTLNDNSYEEFVSIRYIEQYDRRVPWFSAYTGNKHVFFGHWAALGFYHDNKVTCLDGGCVYGNLLIGYCPQEKKFYFVPAQQAYLPIVIKPHKS